jgi:hypothetical protein
MKRVIINVLLLLSSLIVFEKVALAQLANTQTNSELVIRFENEISFKNRKLPEGTVVTSEHAPMNILVVKNTNTSKELFTRLLRNTAGISRIEEIRLDAAGNPTFPTGQVVIQPAPGLEGKSRDFCNEMGCTSDRELENLGWYTVLLPSHLSYQYFEDEAKASGYFEMVVRDEIITCYTSTTNDPFYTSCWSVFQTSDKDIDADLAWDLIPAGSAVKAVAVIDGNGFDTDHPDMAGNWVDIYNAVNQTNNVLPENASDNHGTSCAGIPAAEHNNALGTPGLGANFLQVQPIKIGYNIASGTFSTSSVIQAAAINRAISNASTVCISMSFGSSSSNTAFSSAITTARTTGRGGKGIVVLGSTGNNGTSTWTNYPASYSGVIAVGSSTSADTRSSFSNYGAGLSLAAPGSGIYTIDRTGASGYNSTDYTSFSGTSAACPVAASICGMVLVANANLTEVQVKAIMAQTCDKVGGYTYSTSTTNTLSTWSNELGYGRANMNSAVIMAQQSLITQPNVSLLNLTTSLTSGNAGQSVTVNCQQIISNGPSAPVNVVLQYRWSTDAVLSTSDVLLGADTSLLGGSFLSESESFAFNVPTGGGTRYLLVSCDANNSITEADENNVFSSLFTVLVTSTLPNIYLTNRTVNSLTPTEGQSITVNCSQVISNAAYTPLSSLVEYRWSTDLIWSANDVVIGTNTSALGGGIVSEVETINFIVPPGTGVRYVLFKCDANDLISETNESNTYSTSVTVSAAITPIDITVANLTADDLSANNGQTIQISCTQQTSYSAMTQTNVVLEYRWSLDQLWSTDDVTIASDSSLIGGGIAGENENTSFVIPAGVGARYILVKCDNTSLIGETDENNLYVLAVEVTSLSNLPDVYLDQIVISSASVTVGSSITFNGNQNISLPNATAVNAFMVYRWSTEASYSSSSAIVGVDFSSIGGGDPFDEETITFTVPAGIGQRYLVIRVDDSNLVAEGDETNNVVIIPIMVTETAVANIIANVPSSSPMSAQTETNATSNVIIDESGNEEIAEPKQQELTVSMWPNPAKTDFTIRFNLPLEVSGTYEIRSATGEIVSKNILSEGIVDQRVDVTDLASGVYIIIVQTAVYSTVERVVVAR